MHCWLIRLGMTFEEIMNQASPQNSTVYVGGVTANTAGR